jgi:hypothetical protein
MFYTNFFTASGGRGGISEICCQFAPKSNSKRPNGRKESVTSSKKEVEKKRGLGSEVKAF